MRHADTCETLYIWGKDEKEKFKVAGHIIEPSEDWCELAEQAYLMTAEGDGYRYYVADREGNKVLPSYEELRYAIANREHNWYFYRRALKVAGWWETDDEL